MVLDFCEVAPSPWPVAGFRFFWLGGGIRRPRRRVLRIVRNALTYLVRDMLSFVAKPLIRLRNA